MSLPDSQRQILAAIENELRQDPSLVSEFSAFTSVTRSAGMPAAEQLRPPELATFLDRNMLRLVWGIVALVAAGVIVLAVVLAALSRGGQSHCAPAGAAVTAGHAATCTPLGSGGHPVLRRFTGH